MPITFQFSSNTIQVTLSGRYSIEEWHQTYSDILADARFKQGMNLLVDARQSTVNPNVAEIRQRVTFLKTVVPHTSGRIAVVVSNLLLFGVVRMLSIYGSFEGLNIGTFKEMLQAQDWLDSGQD